MPEDLGAVREGTDLGKEQLQETGNQAAVQRDCAHHLSLGVCTSRFCLSPLSVRTSKMGGRVCVVIGPLRPFVATLNTSLLCFSLLICLF